MERFHFVRLVSEERAFTIVEVAFTSATLFGAVIVMLSMFFTAIDILNYTTTRSLAVQLANEELENARAMDYEQVYNAQPSVWPDDPKINSGPPPKYLDTADGSGTTWRDFVTSTTAGLKVERVVTRKDIDFTVRNYALWVNDTSSTMFKRLIIKVLFDRPGLEGEVVLTNNYAKQDTREPRPVAEIVGVRSTNFNYFKGISQDTTMGMEDTVRGPLSLGGYNDASTPVVLARAQATSAKATGIDRIEFTLYDSAGTAVRTGTVTSGSVDAQGFYKWSMPTNTHPDGIGYLIKAEAFDSLGNSDIATMRINIDNTPPAQPDVNATNIANSAYRVRITWTWSAASSDTVPIVGRFIVLRRPQSESTYVRRAALPGTVYEYNDLNAQGAYWYNLAVVDTAGNYTISMQEKDRVQSKSTPDDTISPSAVTSATVQPSSWKSADLLNSPSTDDFGVKGYNWEATDNLVDWTVVGQTENVAISPIYYQDSGLKPAKTYSYRGFAYDNEGNKSALGTVISVTTPMR